MDVLLFRALSLLGLAILVALAARRLRLPYTVGLVLAGAAVAATRSHAGLALTHDLIFDVVLPPLLFEAALNLRWSDLQRDLAPLIALSTVGVALCAAVTAGGLVALLGWPIESALVFGALVSATDPIAVIALIKESRVTGRLGLLIEAESLFNDGAAAVLFTLILIWAAHDPTRAQDPLAAVTTFLIVAGGGLAAGFGVGLIAIMIVGTSDDHLVETALTAVAAFGSFLIAEHFGASGVLASVAAGMTMGNLGVLTEKERFGISFTPHGRAFVLEFWEFAAFLANSLVFLLIGSALATVDFAREGLLSLMLVIALALLGRAVAVYPVCFAFLRSRWAIPLNQQHLMWWGGLRGALALALALALPIDLPRRDDILISTFAVVAFSVIVQGLTAPLALKALRVAPKHSRPPPEGSLTDRLVVSCYVQLMDRREILARLRENEPALRARGVRHVALFGSRARGDARLGSDIDIMIEFSPEARVTVFNYAGLKDFVASLFDSPVDVVNRDALKPYVRPAATTDAVYAF